MTAAVFGRWNRRVTRARSVSLATGARALNGHRHGHRQGTGGGRGGAAGTSPVGEVPPQVDEPLRRFSWALRRKQAETDGEGM